MPPPHDGNGIIVDNYMYNTVEYLVNIYIYRNFKDLFILAKPVRLNHLSSFIKPSQSIFKIDRYFSLKASSH